MVNAGQQMVFLEDLQGAAGVELIQLGLGQRAEEGMLLHELFVVRGFLHFTAGEGQVQNTLLHLVDNTQVFLHIQLTIFVLGAYQLDLLLQNHVSGLARHDIFNDIVERGHDFLPEEILRLEAQVLAFLDDMASDLLA